MRILSIDLDFIMPKISDFDFIKFNSEEISPEDYWNIFLETYNVDLENNISNAYFFVENIIELLKEYKNDVSLIKNHQEILNIIGENEVSIINLDQHHDIYYGYQDKMAVFNEAEKEKLESSWVYYLYVNNQLKEYTWVTNTNASFSNEHLRFPFSFYIENRELYQDPFGIENLIENYIIKKKFDKIVFVESPYYLPKTKQVNKIINEIKNLSASE